MNWIKKLKCLTQQVKNILNFEPELEYNTETEILTSTYANGKTANTSIPTSETDNNLSVEEVSHQELNIRIRQASLIPYQKYLVTDYKTVEFISGTTELYTAPVEEILLEAINENMLNPIGWSKTYPGEVITYKQDRQILENDYFYGETGNENELTALSNNSFQILTPIPLEQDWTDYYIYIEDNNGESVQFQLGVTTPGFTLNYDENTQTFTVGGSNLEMLDSGYFYAEIDLSSKLPIEDGIIIKREVPKNNIVINCDFRGVKCRRYKTLTNDFQIGINYLERDIVRYQGFIWYAKNNNINSTPNSNSTSWERLFNDVHLLPSNLGNPSGQTPKIVADFSDFQDYDMFRLDIPFIDNFYYNILIESFDNSSSAISLVLMNLGTGASLSLASMRNTKIRCSTDRGLTIQNISGVTINAVERTVIRNISQSNFDLITDSYISECTNSNIKYIGATILGFSNGGFNDSTINFISESAIFYQIFQSSINFIFNLRLYRGTIRYSNGARIINTKIETNSPSSFDGFESNTFASIIDSGFLTFYKGNIIGELNNYSN